MNCPYCDKKIEAMTGFQEASKFATHLNRCRKRPKHVVSIAGAKLTANFGLMDALEIRAKSGQ